MSLATRDHAKRGGAALKHSLSPSKGEEGRGEEVHWFLRTGIAPLSILSPLLRRGERENKTHAEPFAWLAAIWIDTYGLQICAME